MVLVTMRQEGKIIQSSLGMWDKLAMPYRTNRKTRKVFRARKGQAVEEDEKEYIMYPPEKEDEEYDFIDDDYPKDTIGDI